MHKYEQGVMQHKMGRVRILSELTPNTACVDEG